MTWAGRCRCLSHQVLIQAIIQYGSGHGVGCIIHMTQKTFTPRISTGRYKQLEVWGEKNKKQEKHLIRVLGYESILKWPCTINRKSNREIINIILDEMEITGSQYATKPCASLLTHKRPAGGKYIKPQAIALFLAKHGKHTDSGGHLLSHSRDQDTTKQQ